MNGDSDARAFDLRIAEVAELYDHMPLTAQAKRQWWRALDPYPLESVLAAIDQHTRTCSFFPRPADLISRMNEMDGRPAPDEAWSIALVAEDETATLAWSREIIDAWTVARPVLDVGDRIGARRTFLAAYERATTEARRQLRPAEWTLSIGTDPDRRVAAAAAAIRQGRLTRERARDLLGPAPTREPTAIECARVAGLLSGKVVEIPSAQHEGPRRFLAAIQEGLKQAHDHAARERDAKAIEREAARDQERQDLQATLATLATMDADRRGMPESAA